MAKKNFTMTIQNRNSGLVGVPLHNNLTRKDQTGPPSKEKRLRNWINTLSNCEINGMGLGLGNDILLKSQISLAESENSAARPLVETFTSRDTSQNSI